VADVVGPLLVIVGETASGKSSLALELAKQLNGEIISADSWTVYKDFDIGTAKPSKLERAMVPHHMLDIADPRGGFSAAAFQQIAEPVIAAIHSRAKLPILVGGTGLYIDSIIYRYGFLDAPPTEVREQLNRLTLQELLDRAEQRGLITQGIDTRNKRRVIRLIENDGKLPTRQPLRPHTSLLGLQVPREELDERIRGRVDSMITAGLEAEVRRLADEYGWEVEPMKGIGYKEWRPYIEGTQELETTRQKIIKNTKDLAKRQRTWFKRNKSIHWVNNNGDLPSIVDFVTTRLHKV
jgi:tRNA dimethylallyltransferase